MNPKHEGIPGSFLYYTHNVIYSNYQILPKLKIVNIIFLNFNQLQKTPRMAFRHVGNFSRPMQTL
jgi:hypothetical protein